MTKVRKADRVLVSVARVHSMIQMHEPVAIVFEMENEFKHSIRADNNLVLLLIHAVYLSTLGKQYSVTNIFIPFPAGH